MSRGIRLAYRGATYHVYSRGVRRFAVYGGPADYESYLEDLALLSREHAVKVFAFCLMPNHPHLCLRTDGDSISVVMQRLNLRHARRFNREKGLQGHLNESRFKSRIVDSSGYLLQLVRYIHQNPVRACLAETAEGWKYSSHQAYLGDAYPWVATAEVLERFGGRENYLAQMEGRLSPEEVQALEATLMARRPRLPSLLPREWRPRNCGPWASPPPADSAEAAAKVALAEMGVTLEELRAQSRTEAVRAVRRRLVLELRAQGYRLHQIGEVLGTQEAAISRLLQRAGYCDGSSSAEGLAEECALAQESESEWLASGQALAA